MSDHKWDRFKRAFKISPTDTLVTARDGKVRAAIARADVAIQLLTAEGLDADDLRNRRDTAENQRTTALTRGNNTAKCNELDVAKAGARSVADDAEAAAAKRIPVLTADLDAQRSRVNVVINGARDYLTDPRLKPLVEDLLTAATTARDQAALKLTNAEKRDAFALINIDALRAASDRANGVRSSLKSVNTHITGATNSLKKAPDGENKVALQTEIDRLKQAVTDLDDIDDLTAFETRLAEIGKDSKALEGNAYEEVPGRLELILDPIKQLIATARGLPFIVAEPIVDAECRKVETAVADAARLKPIKAQRDALKLIDLKPLNLVIAEARDLDSGVTRLLEGLATVIGKLPDGGAKTGLQGELDVLNGRARLLFDVTDVSTVKNGYAAIKGPADDLMSRAIAARGADKKDDAIKDAIKARFGVDIQITDTAKVNIAGVYDMLSMVPEGHVGHEKLKTICFNNDDKGGGDYKDSFINIGNFDEGDKASPYKAGTKTLKPNAFNVTMLHEIGHSVDDKFGIMAGLVDTAGYGGWRREGRDTVEAEFLAEALKAMGNPDGAVRDLAKNAITTALGQAPVDRPEGLTNPQWKGLKKYIDIALSIGDKKKPWDNADAASIKIGDRVYHDSYGNKWVSYAFADRAGTYVCDYQWRSPDEWFAEIYAIAWLAKKPPPGGVGAAIKEYLPH